MPAALSLEADTTMTDEAQIAQAAAVLTHGGLVGMPTETVYGLAADASSAAAIARIYAAKGRPSDHPVIVHLARVEQIRDWAIDIPDEAWALAKAFWPGPMTLILKRASHVLDAVTGGQDTVGLRIPSHPVAHALLAAFGGGVAAPSANKFGRVSPTTAQHVRDEFGDAIDLVLDGGASHVGIESTIIDCSGESLRILRPGAITSAMVAQALGESGAVTMHHSEKAPRVSGSLDAHYAPRTRLQLVPSEALAETVAHHAPRELAVLSRERPAAFGGHWRRAAPDPAAFARDLYARLRELDSLKAELMLIEAPPQGPQWDGVNDRLRRAAFGSGEA
jgi:L-threonylcarbamoyladenylate synthase